MPKTATTTNPWLKHMADVRAEYKRKGIKVSPIELATIARKTYTPVTTAGAKKKKKAAAPKKKKRVGL